MIFFADARLIVLTSRSSSTRFSFTFVQVGLFSGSSYIAITSQCIYLYDVHVFASDIIKNLSSKMRGTNDQFPTWMRTSPSLNRPTCRFPRLTPKCCTISAFEMIHSILENRSSYLARVEDSHFQRKWRRLNWEVSEVIIYFWKRIDYNVLLGIFRSEWIISFSRCLSTLAESVSSAAFVIRRWWS